MKKLIFLIISFTLALPGISQDKTGKLQNLEQNQGMQQQNIPATTRSAARLFREKDDLTSVITVIPKGAEITVIGSDSSYYSVDYEGSTGFMLRRHVQIGKNAAPAAPNQQANVAPTASDQPAAQDRTVKQTNVSRFGYLEQKYGTSTAARINSGKIWKGMSAEMVKDSWGSPQSINRTISGNTLKEEWRYKNTLLYFRDNVLVDWGPVGK